MKAHTLLAEIPGASAARNIIGKGIQAVSAASHEISYGRRELLRKLIRSDVYPYLYSNPPTFDQLFGGESIESQVSLAKAASKNNTDYIHKRKPKAKFIPNNASKTGFQKGKNQQNQQAGNNSRQGQGRFQRRKGNGKGKKPKTQTDSSATTTKTNN